jgi:hypothetical protein
MSKIDLKPYHLQDQAEANELFMSIQEYYTNSPWPPTLEKIMQGGVIYLRAFYRFHWL